MHIEISNELNESNQSIKLGGLDRSALFGDGFFTTGLIDENGLCHEERHFQRLMNTAEKLSYNSFNIKELQSTLKVILSDVKRAVIRITVYRRQVERGYAVSKQAETVCKITISAYHKPINKPCELFESSVSISKNPTLAGFKHLNRLDSVLAASEVTHSNQEALMFCDNDVICGSRSNLFVKLNGQWVTPKVDQCGIEGITRQRVLEALNNAGIGCEIKNITRSELTRITSAFMTNSIINIWPAVSISGRKLNINESQEIKNLMNSF